MKDDCEKFVGRAVVLDPDTGEPAGFEAYTCLLLTGAERVPGIIVCEAKTLDDLEAKLKASELNARFKHAKLTYEPPTGTYPINNSGALQRFEALTLDELYRFQASPAA